MTNRRQFLRNAGLAGVIGLAGCTGNEKNPEGNQNLKATTTNKTTETTETDTTTESTTTTNTPDEVVIGSIHPFTGPTSYVGTRLHQALKLAAKIKNENGGIKSLGGAKVRVVKGDHKNKPATGAEVAKELINQGVDVLTGTYSSPVASAVAKVAETQQVPFVIDIAVAASILQKRKLDYVYRVQPNSWSQAADHVTGITAIADQANIDVGSAALFYVDMTYGHAIKKGLERAFKDTSIEVVEKSTIGFGGTADTQVTKFRQANPDILIPTVFTNQMLELVDSMQDQNYWPKMFAPCASAGMNPKTFKKMGKVINGALPTGYAINPHKKKAEQINKRYMKTYDTASMTANVAVAYTTGEVLTNTFEEAGSTDPQKLNRTLEKIKVSDHILAMPPISFTKRGENANPLSVTSQVQNMQNKIVYPDRYAEANIKVNTIGQ
ncbi:MAG: ABC transporter substrate-binding protein [Halobacteriaceae archaeon]